MNRRWINTIVVLTIALISLVSISSAAGPLARPDLFTGVQCGADLSVPAPGILKNDLKPTGPIQVKDPETITIDPKYGSLKVKADGSFVYTAAPNFPASTSVYFYYRVTDGIRVSNAALVKIVVSCKCRGAAPEINVCPGTAITTELLMSKGAGCFGCRDATPKFDLRKIPAQPVAGQCYPYTVSCPGCHLVTGYVCFSGCDDGNACTADTCDPETGDCVYTPIVCNDGNSCTSDACDPETGCTHEAVDCDDGNECTIDTCDPVTGCVHAPVSCDFASEPMAFSLPPENCPDIMPTDGEIIAMAGLECTCPDTTPLITIPPHLVAEDDFPIWEYTAFCGSVENPECGATVDGQFTSSCELPPPDCSCAPTAPDLCSCIDSVLPREHFGFPMEQFKELGGGCNPDSDCDVTPTIDDSAVDYTIAGLYQYTVSCLGCDSYPVTATGRIRVGYATCSPKACICDCCI